MSLNAMQRIRKLFDDDSAVSPVIGVILMVAITVILAAVIASFVLGLGDQTDDVSPNIQFDTDYKYDEGNVTLTISTADDQAEAQDIELTGSAVNGTVAWNEGGATLGAGEALTMNVTDQGFQYAQDKTTGDWNNDVAGEEIIVTFETESTSDTLATYEVPEEP